MVNHVNQNLTFQNYEKFIVFLFSTSENVQNPLIYETDNYSYADIHTESFSYRIWADFPE